MDEPAVREHAQAHLDALLAAVGEQQVDRPIAVGVGELDLVAPVLGPTDGLFGHFLPGIYEWTDRWGRIFADGWTGAGVGLAGGRGLGVSPHAPMTIAVMHVAATDGGSAEPLVEDVANNCSHPAGHRGETIGTQLVDQNLSPRAILSRFVWT
jgi:hypothetical protein